VAFRAEVFQAVPILCSLEKKAALLRVRACSVHAASCGEVLPAASPTSLGHTVAPCVLYHARLFRFNHVSVTLGILVFSCQSLKCMHGQKECLLSLYHL
jgi:hypothetical protein